MTQMMQFEPTFSAFTTVPTFAYSDGMIAQAIGRTQITPDSILMIGERRDTTVPDIIDLGAPLDVVVDPAAPKKSYQYSTARKVDFHFDNTTIAQLSTVTIVLLHGQEARAINDGDQYFTVYTSRFGPTPTTGKPVQHLGPAFRLGPNEHRSIV